MASDFGDHGMHFTVEYRKGREFKQEPQPSEEATRLRAKQLLESGATCVTMKGPNGFLPFKDEDFPRFARTA
jgi:hypothetical protein